MLTQGSAFLTLCLAAVALGVYLLLRRAHPGRVAYLLPDPVTGVTREHLHATLPVDGRRPLASTRYGPHAEIARLLTQLQESYDQTLAALCAALDVRDRETEGHSRRVAELACAIAREMELPEEEVTHLYRGGLLHDVGKIGIPDAVLHKPGPLTDEEWELMRQHPLLGAHILQGIDFLARAVEVVLFHQERYDGRGYPYGLRGAEIPLLARIFAVADAYDAMTSHRPYRPAMSHEEAVAEILRNSGTQFDPEVVRIFLRVVERFQTSPRVPSSNGSVPAPSSSPKGVAPGMPHHC